MTTAARLAIDIGGTFTDVVLEHDGRHTTRKILTSHASPADAVLAGTQAVCEAAGVAPDRINLIIHGTTLATNALIERRGAVTALITTRGHRDALEMAYENRFEQYDINIDRPPPLVPRALRLTVDERIGAGGVVLRPLDEHSVLALLPILDAAGVTSVAIGLLHAYANAEHEQRIADLLGTHRPQLSLTLASAVCPEIREFERLSTACANAYVRPLMARYLHDLAARLQAFGCTGPVMLMTSGGGLTTLDTAARFPIRLVESGPAGGALLAAQIARDLDLDAVLSFDMGGTTAKICLIDAGQPQLSRAFEVDRRYRFRRGSGLPVRIPVIEMVEIGAGGGSLAAVDGLGRITVGPASAGSDPGPAAYGLGGTCPAVTDADVLLGRLDVAGFAGGSFTLDLTAARHAIEQAVATPLGLDVLTGAWGISEVVDENMAAAARAHAVEWGRDAAGRTLIAFGGAAPLHAARLADKLRIDRILVPAGAGVGSAIGFLLAPISFEVVRSHYMLLSQFDPEVVNAVMADMRAESSAVIRAASSAPADEIRRAFMRYAGQGYEIAVAVPAGQLTAADGPQLRRAFDAEYTRLYGRTIDNLDVEILSWTLTLSVVVAAPAIRTSGSTADHAEASADVQLWDAHAQALQPASRVARVALDAATRVPGPALITEAQTTTVVPRGFTCRLVGADHLLLERNPAGGSAGPGTGEQT